VLRPPWIFNRRSRGWLLTRTLGYIRLLLFSLSSYPVKAATKSHACLHRWPNLLVTGAAWRTRRRQCGLGDGPGRLAALSGNLSCPHLVGLRTRAPESATPESRHRPAVARRRERVPRSHQLVAGPIWVPIGGLGVSPVPAEGMGATSMWSDRCSAVEFIVGHLSQPQYRAGSRRHCICHQIW
jgi:hypothetical protein